MNITITASSIKRRAFVFLYEKMRLSKDLFSFINSGLIVIFTYK